MFPCALSAGVRANAHLSMSCCCRLYVKLCSIVANPLTVYEDSSEGYVSVWYLCTRDCHKRYLFEHWFAVNDDKGDIAAQVFGVAYLALAHKHLYRVGWHNRFHAGLPFPASRVDIASISLGRQT